MATASIYARYFNYTDTPIPVDVETSQPIKDNISKQSNKKTPEPVKKSNEPKKIDNNTELPFMFGIGTELDHAIKHRITKEAPVKMLSSWYNGPGDLEFMNGWRTTKVPQAYKSGYSLHLIIYTNGPEQPIKTAYGQACGRAYPLSSNFIDDMKLLSNIFKGGKLYVSMFTEFQTYPCNDNTWKGSENYYRALKDQYLATMKIFHQNVPGSQVSLSWGGWQANWDDTAKGAGLSLVKRFEDALNASDFQSFQAMSTTDNLDIILKMTDALSPYRGGIMVSHYKPDNGSQAVFDKDVRTIFTADNMTKFKNRGLFALSFMDSKNIDTSETSYLNVKKLIKSFSH